MRATTNKVFSSSFLTLFSDCLIVNSDKTSYSYSDDVLLYINNHPVTKACGEIKQKNKSRVSIPTTDARESSVTNIELNNF